MSAPKCNEYDYINFLVAAQQQYSCLEASRVQPCPEDAPSHDSLTRLLHRLEPSPQRLWSEVAGLVDPGKGALVIDDTLLDKPHSRRIELVTRHWSGRHRRSVPGIPLVSLVWTDGDRQLPTDCRAYAKGHDGLDKHPLCRQMPGKAKERGFSPECVLFDSWHASLETLKLLRSRKWHWMTRLKKNRQVNPDGSGNIPLTEAGFPGGVRVAPEGLRHGQGLPDCRLQRRHGILGRQPPGLGGTRPAPARRVVLAHRAPPQGDQAVLRHREGPGALREGTAKPHRHGAEGLHPARSLCLPKLAVLVRGQAGHHPRGHPKAIWKTQSMNSNQLRNS